MIYYSAFMSKHPWGTNFELFLFAGDYPKTTTREVRLTWTPLEHWGMYWGAPAITGHIEDSTTLERVAATLSQLAQGAYWTHKPPTPFDVLDTLESLGAVELTCDARGCAWVPILPTGKRTAREEATSLGRHERKDNADDKVVA